VGKATFESQAANIEKSHLPTKAKNVQINKEFKELQKKGFISDERYAFLKRFLRDSISQKVTSYKSENHNESVLPSPLTKLVNIFIDENLKTIMTIDSDALVRIWSMTSGECIGSYPIELRKEELTDKKKLTSCTVDREMKHIVVAYESGIVQVNNLHSGQLLFNETEDMMVLDNEVSDLRFFPENCNFWFAAACWEGRVTFFQEQ
jgi:WD40 repeat protein